MCPLRLLGSSGSLDGKALATQVRRSMRSGELHHGPAYLLVVNGKPGRTAACVGRCQCCIATARQSEDCRVRVLVVDDHLSNRKLLRIRLEASRGQVALVPISRGRSEELWPKY
jgi:hypothetical protein